MKEKGGVREEKKKKGTRKIGKGCRRERKWKGKFREIFRRKKKEARMIARVCRGGNIKGKRKS